MISEIIANAQEVLHRTIRPDHYITETTEVNPYILS